jgi:hypothetical protein
MKKKVLVIQVAKLVSRLNLLFKGDGPVKKMMVALIATIFLVSLLGCTAQIADKAAWDEQTRKTLEAQDAVTTYNRIGGR